MKEFETSTFTIGKPRNNIFGKIFKIIFILFLCFFSSVYMFYIFFFNVNVYGSSMYPTFSDKNDEIALALRFFNLYHGDTVVILLDDTLLLKRVIALGDDELSLILDKSTELCSYYINGQKLDEPYIKSEAEMNRTYFNKVEKLDNIQKEETTALIILTLNIPHDEVFVLGDNRGVSKDSSSLGPMKRNNVQGKVILKYKGWKTG